MQNNQIFLLFLIIIIYHKAKWYICVYPQPKEITNPKEFLNLLKDTKGADKTKTKAAKKSNYLIMQLSSLKETPRSPNLKSEEEDISTPSKLISKTSSKPSSQASERMLNVYKSKREELLPRKPKNDSNLFKLHHIFLKQTTLALLSLCLKSIVLIINLIIEV